MYSAFVCSQPQENFMTTPSVRPQDIQTATNPYGFMGSGFRNDESETVARNIVMLLQKANPASWTSFSWDDYKKFCTHRVSDAERRVLDAMVSGERPAWNTSANLAPGYLKKSDDRYEVTKQFIDALPAEVKVAGLAS